MNRTIYLHIGTGKTGTTTIQDMLAGNREELLRQGFVYPEVNGERSHVSLMLYSSRSSMNDLFRVWIKSSAEADKERFRQTFPQRLEDELAKYQASGIVFSSEHLSALLKTDAELATLKNLLSTFGDRIKIIIYLRRQDEILLSLYSTHVKGGLAKPPEDLMAKPVSWFDYSALLDLWAGTFGKENMQIRIFEKAQFKNGKLEDDFLHCLGIADASRFKYIKAKNSSLDNVRLEFLRRFNEYVPRIEGETKNPLRDNLTLILEQTSSQLQLSYDQDTMTKFFERYEESNRQVAVDYLHRSDGILFTAARARENVDRPLELTIDEAVKISAQLWVAKQTTIMKLEERIAKLKKIAGKSRLQKSGAAP